MNKYELDLTSYPVDFERWVIKDEKRELETGVEDLDVKKEISDLLRLNGVYDDGTESFDGLMLAKQIRETETDSIEISKTELILLKKVMDKLIGREHNPAKGLMSLGGQRYEEMIIRVYGLGRE